MKILLTYSFLILFLGCAVQPPPVVYYSKPSFSLSGTSIGIVQVNGYAPHQVEPEIVSYLMSRNVNVVERTQLSSILSEQGIQLLGLTKQQAVEIGKITGLRYLLIGNLSTPSVVRVAHWGDNTWETWTTTFTCRVVDAQSGEVVMSGSSTGKRGYPNYAISDAIKNFFYRY